jgi:uncharacterized protein YegL
MPNPLYTDITMLLDRSGSMSRLKEDIEGGFDAFIQEQRAQEGICRVSLSQFDNRYDVVYTARDIADVPPLQLHPRGMTALLDAIGTAIAATRERLDRLPDADKPGVVIIGIMTDGLENASTEMTYPAVKALIEEYERQHDWIFTYMGANQDAIEEGAKMGIRRDQTLTYAAQAAPDAMRVYSANITRTRHTSAAGGSRDDITAAAAFTEAEREEAGGADATG